MSPSPWEHRPCSSRAARRGNNSCSLQLFVQRPVWLPLPRNAGWRTQVRLELFVFLRNLEMVVVAVSQQWGSTLLLRISRGMLLSSKPVLRAWGRQKSSEEGIQPDKREGRSWGWSELHPVLSPAEHNFRPQSLKPWGARELPLQAQGFILSPHQVVVSPGAGSLVTSCRDPGVTISGHT